MKSTRETHVLRCRVYTVYKQSYKIHSYAIPTDREAN